MSRHVTTASRPFFHETEGVTARDYCAMFLYLERRARKHPGDLVEAERDAKDALDEAEAFWNARDFRYQDTTKGRQG